MHAKTITKGVLSLGAWSVIKILASAAATPLLTRILGAGAYGQYASYLAILFLASSLSNLGTSQTLTKVIAEGPDDASWRRRVARKLAPVSATGILLVSGAVAAFVIRYAPAGADTALVVAALIGTLAAEQGSYFARGILFGLHREELAGIPAALGAIIAPATGVVLAYAGLGVPGVFLGLLAGAAFVAAVTLVSSRRALSETTGAPSPASPPLELRPLLGFGLTSMLFSALSMALYRVDVVLVRMLSPDAAQAGLYAASVQLSEFVWVVPLAVEGVMLQTTARLWSDNQTERITEILSRLNRYTALGVSFLLALVTVFAPTILRLYVGPEYAGAATALRILAPGVLGFSLARVMWPVIQARGQVLMLATIVGAATAVNVILNILLIPRWGAVGAAIAASIAYGGVGFAYVALLRTHSVSPLRNVGIARIATLVVGVMAVTASIRCLPLPPALTLALGGALGTLVYAAGAIALGLLTVSELQKIIGNLPSFLAAPCGTCFEKARPILATIEKYGIGEGRL